VLEVNVDGTSMYVPPTVLRPGSHIHRCLVTDVANQPRDSQHHVYLAYDPAAFGLLLSYLKQVSIFGMEPQPQDPAYWREVTEAKGINPDYLIRVAGHFGASEVVLALSCRMLLSPSPSPPIRPSPHPIHPPGQGDLNMYTLLEQLAREDSVPTN
jgi:hypothetical protein